MHAIVSRSIFRRSSNIVAPRTFGVRPFSLSSAPFQDRNNKIATLLVQDVQYKKLDSRPEWTIDENASVFEATKKMVDMKTGGLCVTRESEIIGIVTERDYLLKVVHLGRTSQTAKVSDICTEAIFLANKNDTIQDCVDIMASKNIRHLPVTDDSREQIIGLLSIKDIAKALSNEQEKTLDTLREIETKSRMPIHDG